MSTAGSLAGRVRRQRLGLFFNSSSKVFVDAGEHLISPLTRRLLRRTKMAGDVLDKVFLLTRLLSKDLPKLSGLIEVFVSHGELLGNSSTSPFLMLLRWLDRLVGEISVSRWVIGIGTVVSIDGHNAITLVGVKGAERSVDRNLLVVDTETMTVGIWIRE